MTRDPKKIRDAHDALIAMYRDHKIKPLVWRSFPLAELPDALGALESRASHGKIVVRP
jgi:NADPH:quinone reductase-like Zn-dependent oxidoreductase